MELGIANWGHDGLLFTKRGLCGHKSVVQVQDVAVLLDSKQEYYSKDAGICPSGCYIYGNICCVPAWDLLLLKCVTVLSNLVVLWSFD